MNDTKEESENAEYRVLPEIKRSGRKFFDYWIFYAIHLKK
jgi:hypothetical protein